MRNLLFTMTRGGALALGGFILLNFIGEQCREGFDANLWWIDLRALPALPGDLLLLMVAFALAAFGLRPVMSRPRRGFSVAAVACILLFALANAWTFRHLLARGDIVSTWPVPLSLFMAIAFVCILLAMWNAPAAASDVSSFPTGWPHRLALVVTVALACAAFPLAQMFFFGSTDYTRKADVAIVLGARAYADGRPSAPLEDRLRTACDLFAKGQVRFLLMTGGPGDGDIHETEAMRRFAVSLGIPSDRILLDPHGVNTQASVKHTTQLLEARGLSRALVVSHGYHLPRIKLAYQRAGWEVFTVPARERHRLRAKPAYLAREIAAMWWYYLSPLWS
ncbi:MAG: YdcF family protein [Phycisphaeraceae bacterium]